MKDNLPIVFVLITIGWVGGYFMLALILDSIFKSLSKSKHVFKIQDTGFKDHHFKREVFYSFISCLIFSAATCLLYWMHDSGETQLYTTIDPYKIIYYPFSLILVLIAQDFYFYWTHRLLHLPFLMRRVHATHHLSHQPSTYTAFSFHPVEAVIQAAILPILPCIIPMHTSVIFIFAVYNLIVNMIGHSGYEFFPVWFKKSWFGRISNTPVYHDYHHQRANGNFGLYFNVWDKWMNTYKPISEKNFYSIKEIEEKNKIINS